MKTLCSAILAALLLVSPATQAAESAPDDFAFGFEVETEASAPLLELSLPDQVYSGVVRPDLGDLRVFNRSGEVLPHALGRPPVGDAAAPVPVDLPFFPLHEARTVDTDRRVLHIVTDDKGAILSSLSEPLRPGEGDRVVAYLVDASALEEAPVRLVLDWTGADAAGFAVNLDVLGGDDLSHWSPLVRGATLADLRSGDAALRHDEIVLPGRKVKYLRIDWPEAMKLTRPTRIQAQFAFGEAPPAHRSVEIEGTREDDGWRFDAHGFRPVDQARVGFAEPNMVVVANLYSRDREDGPWQFHHSGVVYSIEHEGTRLDSDPIRLAATTDRFWRLSPARGQADFESPPHLELGWIPHRLTFVARGDPPYTVAFGSATIGPAERPVETLLHNVGREREKELIATARASEVVTLGGEDKRQPPPPPLPWKKWLLWAVLLAGVAMLMLMVRGLLSQLGASRGTGGGGE